MNYYFYFPIREFTTSTQKAIEEINRLASDSKKSFCLYFDAHNSERIRVQSCKGKIKKASFWLTERTPFIEAQVDSFNKLLPKNPIVLAVGIADEICITVVVND